MKIVVLDSSQADLYQNGEEREACPAIRLNYVTNELPRLLAYTEDQDTDWLRLEGWYYVMKVELALIFINYIIHGTD